MNFKVRVSQPGKPDSFLASVGTTPCTIPSDWRTFRYLGRIVPQRCGWLKCPPGKVHTAIVLEPKLHSRGFPAGRPGFQRSGPVAGRWRRQARGTVGKRTSFEEPRSLGMIAIRAEPTFPTMTTGLN